MAPILAVIFWILALVSYVVAVFMPSFRQMGMQVLNKFALVLFALMGTISLVTIANAIFRLEPNDAGIILYTASALCWVPFVAVQLRFFKNNTVDAVLPQQIVVIGSLFGALIVTMSLWGDVEIWMKAGLLVWCTQSLFDATLWILLYINWIHETSEPTLP